MAKPLWTVAITLLLGGCLAPTLGAAEQVSILSEPPGARVKTSLGHVCVTPCMLDVSGRAAFTLTYELDAYETLSVRVRTRSVGAGKAPPSGVDAASGSALEHTPNPVRALLVRSQWETPPIPLAARRKLKRDHSRLLGPSE